MNSNTNGFDHEAIVWVRDHVRGLSRDERLFLMYLATRCNPSHECFPDQRLMARDLECSRDLVISIIKKLVNKELVSKKRRPNTSTLYTLHVSGSRSTQPLPEVATGPTSGSRCQNDHKKPIEVTKRSNQEKEVYEDKRGNDASCHCGQKTEKGLEKKDGKELQKKESFAPKSSDARSDALKITAKYYKQVPTQRGMVGFWWALMRRYFPDYPTKKLTYHQFRALKSVFDVYGDQAFYILAAAISEWDQAAVYACQIEGGLKPFKNEFPKYGDIPVRGPTPTFISKAATGFADYWTERWQTAKAA